MDEIILENFKIEDMIFEIRGRQVMLDSDLAKLYQCKNGTKEINQAVKNNLEKFPLRFSFRLTEEESQIFLVKNFDQKVETRGGKYRNPRVFTEQGVAMLATILKSVVATHVSIKIMDAFVAMRKYLSTNLIEQKYINEMVLNDNKRIDLLEETFSKFDEKKKINEIYFAGQIWDSFSKIIDILKEANHELIIVDAYADKETLDLIKNLKVSVIFNSKNEELTF